MPSNTNHAEFQAKLKVVSDWIFASKQPDGLLDEARQLFRRRWAIVLWVMAVPLVLLFGVCDLYFKPEMAYQFFKVRSLVIPVAIIAHLSYKFNIIRSRYYTFPLFFLTAYLVLYNCYLIYYSGLEASPYYAGLNLVALGSLGFLPLSIKEVTAQILVTLLPYCILLSFCSDHNMDLSKLVPNLFFMVGTAFLGLIANIEFRNLRLVEYSSRAQLTQALETLNRTRAELLRTEKFAAIGNMSGSIAHEVNTPIGVCIKAQGILEDAAKSLEQKQTSGNLKKSDLEHHIQSLKTIIPTIRNNLNRASHLIESFKTVATEAHSDVKVKVHSVAFFEELLVSLKPLLSGSLHQFKSDLEDFDVSLFPGYLSQILGNLINNSIKHGFESKTEGGIITLVVRRGGSAWTIEYYDNGSGIPDEIKDKVFDPFFTTKKYMGGTGLGLSVIYTLVTNKMGGTQELTKEQSGGFGLVINLPFEENSRG
jgi:signal transduction histidine kinase